MAVEGEYFELQITALTKKWKIETQSSETLQELKEQLSEKYEVPVAAMVLMKGKKKLIDATKTLADLEIDGSTRLICVVRLMNVITHRTMEGKWFFLGLDSPFMVCKIENETFYIKENGWHPYEFTITEEGFGFKNAEMNQDFLFKPDLVSEGVIKCTILKFHEELEGKNCFWFRRYDESDYPPGKYVVIVKDTVCLFNTMEDNFNDPSPMMDVGEEVEITEFKTNRSSVRADETVFVIWGKLAGDEEKYVPVQVENSGEITLFCERKKTFQEFKKTWPEWDGANECDWN